VVLKEDFLTQQFLNSQLLASAGFNGGHFGVGATQFQTGGLGAFQNAGFAQGTLGAGAQFQGAGQLAQQGGQVVGGQQQDLAGQQEQLRQLQLQREQLVRQQAQQMAAQTPQQTAAGMNGGGGAAGDPSGIDTLRAEATAAAVEILRKEIADLKAVLSQPGAVVTPQVTPPAQQVPQYQQGTAPARQPNGNGNGVKPQAVPQGQPTQPIPPAREEARRVARK
jgi:hypothetical protein